MTKNYKTELIDDPEINALLNKIKPDGTFQILRSLSGSRKNPSRNTVFEICVFDDLQNHWADMVIKIGDCKPIKDEFDNFSKYVLEGSLRPEYKVILHEPIYGINKAIMRIDFMNLEIYQTLIDYYKENPIAALNTLLNSALKPWHQKMKDISCKSKEHIPTRLKDQKDDLLNECERLFPEFAASSECYVQMLKRVCINPVFLLQKDEIDLKKSKGYFWSGESIVHGDLNFNNILIENENHLKLIDFEYTRRDIIFDDMARLECEIKFICLKQNYDENFCKGLLAFEELITHNLRIKVNELPENAKVYEDIKKAAKCIAVIRERVYEIIQQSDQITEIAYWIELLIRTLKYVSYQSEDGISQLTDYKKKYALISALLLAQNYLKEPEIKTLQPPLIVSICPEKHEIEDSTKMQSAINKKIENSEKDYPVPVGIEKIEYGSFSQATQNQIKQYYDGNLINWGIVSSDGIIEREAYSELVEKWIPPTHLTNMICIVGDAGEGKTSLAWKFIYEMAKQQDCPIYQIWNSERSVWAELKTFYNESLQKPFIVLVDDVFRDEDVIVALQNIGNQIPMTILATSRTNEYRSERRLSFDVESINLKRPSYSEKERIINKIGNSKLENIKKDLLEESVPFLVFMMEVTHGKKFQDIIRDEIERLKKLDPIVYKAYRYVCSTYRFQISIPKPLLERIDNDFYDIEIEELHPASAGIIIEDDYFLGNLRARHPLIAEHSLKYYIGRDTTIDKMFNVIDVKSIIERKSMLHLFREMAKNNHPDLDNILSVNKEKIEDVFKNATISEMAVWRFIFEKINAEDMIPRCMDIALSINPVSGSDCLWLKKFSQEKGEEIKSVPKIKEYLDVINPEDITARAVYLGLVERNGTPEQKKKVIPDTEKWLSENPKDTFVRGTFLGLVERNGTPEQKKKVISDTEKWLSENPKDTFVRGPFFGLVERNGTPEQKKKVISDTEKWLSENPKDTFVRGPFFGLVERNGTPEQKKKVISDTEKWLSENPKDTFVRGPFFGLVERNGTPEQKKKVISDTEKWLSENPKDTFVHGTFLGLVERNGTPEQKKKVIPDTEKWLSENPKDTFVRGTFLGLVERNGTPEQKKKVIPDTEKWLSENPKDTFVRGPFFGLVERNGTPEQKKKVISDTEKWLSENPKDTFVRGPFFGLVERNGTPEQKKKVISDTEKWLSENPKDNAVRGPFLGLVERNGTPEQKKKVISDTEKWLSENPKDNAVRGPFFGLVERNGTPEQKKKVISDTEKWLSENPDQANIWELFITYLIKENDLAKTIEVVKHAIKLNPDYSNLLSIYLRLMQNILPEEEVKNLYTQLLDVIPGDINKIYHYANWLQDHECFIESENLYKALIRKDIRNFKPFYGYGCLLLKLERFEEASEKFRETLNIRERHALAHDKLALSLIELENFDEAKYELNSAIYWANKQNGKLGIFYHDFGLYYLKLKLFKEAESYFRKSIDEEPQNFANYWHLGEACFFQKHYKIAEKALLTALDKAPDDLGPPASEKIDELLKECGVNIQKSGGSDNDTPIDQIVHDLNEKFSK